MYNNIYQEYINNMLGTPARNTIGFEQNDYFQTQNQNYNLDLEQFYPDLYRLIYPMVQTACMRNTKPLTKECIDEMVKEIYDNFVHDNENVSNEVRNSKSVSKSTVETRQSNFVLNDLIRILLIRELLRRPGNVFPRPPSRPPFPGPGRPPFRNDINFDLQDYSIYEN